MSMSGNPMETHKNNDNLTAIKGIGSVRQRWLREALNVHSYHDLAALSIDKIESRLKADHQIISRKEIKGWIDAAKERIADDPKYRLEGDIADRDTADKPKFPIPEAEWNSIAAYFVQLQTRKGAGEWAEQRITAKHIPVARNGTWLEEDPKKEPVEFDGEQQGERLYEWMQAQVIPEFRIKSQLSAPIAELSQQETEPIRINVQRIRLFQPTHSSIPLGIGEKGEIFGGLIKGNESFNIEVSFELSGTPIFDESIYDSEYWVRCYAYNRSTREYINLGNTKLAPLSKNTLVYTSTLSNISLPPGFYRLQAIVELMEPLRSLGFLELSLLRVGEVSVYH